MPSNRHSASLVLLAFALAGCSQAGSKTTADGAKVRSVLEARLGITLELTPKVVETPTLSNVRNVYSAQSASERILVVVFDSPAATRQILGEQGRLDGGEIVRHGNVTVLYTVRTGRANRAATIRRALNNAFD